MLTLYEALQDLFQSKKNNKAKGTRGEEIARKLLVDKGYKILESNYFYGKLEIDIVAEYQNVMVFVEVKSRTLDYLVEPALAVNIKKQKSIIKAADGYLREREIELESRFDIITVTWISDTKTDIEHHEGAYYPFM
ncbi:MAG TPA: YraN family protein [Flavobacteriales bacterium]|nr:YraN family protein [Flavobacteriales bacterium]